MPVLDAADVPRVGPRAVIPVRREGKGLVVQHPVPVQDPDIAGGARQAVVVSRGIGLPDVHGPFEDPTLLQGGLILRGDVQAISEAVRPVAGIGDPPSPAQGQGGLGAWS